MGSVQRRAKRAEVQRRLMLSRLAAMFEDTAGPFSTVEHYDPESKDVRVFLRDEDGEILGQKYYKLVTA